MKEYEELFRLKRQMEEIGKLQNPLGGLMARQQEIVSAAATFKEREAGFAQALKQWSQIGALYDPAIANLAKLNFPRISLPSMNLATQAAALLPELDLAKQHQFARPDLAVLPSLATHAATLVEAHSRFSSTFAWQNDLAARMRSLQTDWALPEYADGSAYAFARLARLNDTVLRDVPYAPATRDYVETEFGDVVIADDDDTNVREQLYDDAGRDPALVAFPVEEYSIILQGAGFDFQIPKPPVPQPIANADGPTRFDDQATLRALELHLRAFIISQMTALAGASWLKQRVPPTMRDRWLQRQEEYRSKGWPIFELIHYADFTDLAQLMAQGNNWNDVFKSVFGDKEGMLVSLRRLSPLRNNSAHSRPLGPSEILFMSAETLRLLRAIGVMKLDS